MNMGKYGDVSKWQKVTDMLVAQFLHVSKWTVQHVCRELCTDGGHEARWKIYGSNKILT